MNNGYCFTPVTVPPWNGCSASQPMPDKLSLPLLIQASTLRFLELIVIAPLSRQLLAIDKFPDNGMEVFTSGRKQLELDDIVFPEFGMINVQREA